MNILIVGAGIAGLSLARRLDELNIQYTLIARAPHWPKQGAGICLPANAVAGTEKLGHKPLLLNMSHQVNTIKFAKDNGTLLTQASLQLALACAFSQK